LGKLVNALDQARGKPKIADVMKIAGGFGQIEGQVQIGQIKYFIFPLQGLQIQRGQFPGKDKQPNRGWQPGQQGLHQVKGGGLEGETVQAVQDKPHRAGDPFQEDLEPVPVQGGLRPAAQGEGRIAPRGGKVHLGEHPLQGLAE